MSVSKKAELCSDRKQEHTLEAEGGVLKASRSEDTAKVGPDSGKSRIGTAGSGVGGRGTRQTDNAVKVCGIHA